MTTTLRASVRTVVEFSCRSGDLRPGSMQAMRDGTKAHLARQGQVPHGQAEVSVRGTVQGEHLTLDIRGRIDLLSHENGMPVIEEIKLSADTPPAAVIPVHRAQAICYAHLLGQGAATVRVTYASMSGQATAMFQETVSESELQQAFDMLVAPYLAMAEGRFLWQNERDRSLSAMPFPFDAFRPSQRDLSKHTYWAVKARRRLFAEAPTGTGKTAAILFGALKALGAGMTQQIFYLTARTTGQQNAEACLARMRAHGLRLRAVTLTAKEKVCPYGLGAPFPCDVLSCPHAIGFFDRLEPALSAIRKREDWTRETVLEIALTCTLCPFELSLVLTEEADCVVCDYNYALDPCVRLQRVFNETHNLTLLTDEAHHLTERARAMLSGTLDSLKLREARRAISKIYGRKGVAYKALTALIRAVEIAPDTPDGLLPLVEAALSACSEHGIADMARVLVSARMALQRYDGTYRMLFEKHGKTITIQLLCLDPAPYLTEITKKLRGVVYFSATLTPLPELRMALGGQEADALLSLPSPFAPEHLLVLTLPADTRYHQRERTAKQIADAIHAVATAKSGNYLACFPSYAYLAMVREQLIGVDTLTLHVQQSRMDETARADYLSAFVPRETGSMLGMIVLGGVFAEGIDLPGDRLSGVMVVGIGLPQIAPEGELIKEYYEQKVGDGFHHAYRIPGLTKVVQAVGRVIRTETDRGVALLIDTRYQDPAVHALLPVRWSPIPVRDAGEIRHALESFWS